MLYCLVSKAVLLRGDAHVHPSSPSLSLSPSALTYPLLHSSSSSKKSSLPPETSNMFCAVLHRIRRLPVYEELTKDDECVETTKRAWRMKFIGFRPFVLFGLSPLSQLYRQHTSTTMPFCAPRCARASPHALFKRFFSFLHSVYACALEGASLVEG